MEIIGATEERVINPEVKVERVVYPEYWQKRKHKLNKEFVEQLERTAKAEPEAKDKYGYYKAGVFLFRSCVVTYLPDNIIMAQLFGSRVDDREMRGVTLYQIPDNTEADDIHRD